jgi:hypothetical protein
LLNSRTSLGSASKINNLYYASQEGFRPPRIHQIQDRELRTRTVDLIMVRLPSLTPIKGTDVEVLFDDKSHVGAGSLTTETFGNPDRYRPLLAQSTTAFISAIGAKKDVHLIGSH